VRKQNTLFLGAACDLSLSCIIIGGKRKKLCGFYPAKVY
jgi:hypothetical protein